MFLRGLIQLVFNEIENKGNDLSSYDVNNHSDDGASSFCSCSSCEYYTDCSCCPDESLRDPRCKSGHDAEREEDEGENQFESVTTTNSSVDTVYELGRDKGNKNINKIGKLHKDKYVVNGSIDPEKCKNSEK